jgi:formylglycine-generating enzyme required for sulfatase activity
VGKLVYLSGDTDKPLALVGELCPAQAKDDAVSWRKVWLAGEALLEIDPNRTADSELGKDLAARVPERLVELITGAKLTVRERATVGDTQARLGAPRFHGPDRFCLPNEPLLGFVEIPAGKFLMGSDKRRDPQAFDDELPQHEVFLPAYYMARYPVTVDQFRVFVQDSGYTPAAKNSLNRTATHPVVNVTWYDALKYCEWLTEKLRISAPQADRSPFWQGLREGKLRVTLPSEAEWEKAARGTDGRIYPWGDEWDNDRLNAVVNIGRTSAVGCFPNGKGPYDILDMSGNVWEWTRSLWGKDFSDPEFKYPYDPKDKRREDLNASGKVWRVWRGGSWDDDQSLARCSYRGRGTPDRRFNLAGFRCVLRFL